MHKSDAQREQVRVGDLIATRAPQQQAHWSISVVRWVRSAGPGDIEFGAQRLAPSAEAIAILPAATGNGEIKMALLLPEVKALRQASTLITPRGMFAPGRQLILDNGYRTYPIRATKLMNVTGSFEQFQFARDV